MPNKTQSCLSSDVLEQIGRNEVSPDELIAIESHVSQCARCRDLFDSDYSSSQWSDVIKPALSESRMAVTSTDDDAADHSSAILKLLGPTDDPNMLGRIGNYEIVGVIGQGGMGAVFKGFDRSLNRFVAIKMLLPHLAASGAARKRFAREGQAIAAVVDDHVMAIHGVDQWQGIPYLVMTYSRGASLQKRINEHGPMEVREILRIGMQAARGLSAAHAQGIVHRDIKPSNILLDQNVERVQLVDFGLARAVDDASLTCTGTLAGTPQYMSPEQASAETVDNRSDLFSLGSVLYAMCTGHAPFRAESSYSVLRLIIEKEPRPIREINSEIPDWLCSIIEKLMSKSPDSRYASADEVANILEQCLAHVQDPMQHPLPAVARVVEKKSKNKSVFVSKLREWFPIMNDKRIVSLISLILMLIALMVPLPAVSLGMSELAFSLAFPAAVLSMAFALLSRTEYFSKVVLWVSGSFIGIAIVALGISVPIYMWRGSYAQVVAAEVRAEAIAKAELAKIRAEEKLVPQQSSSRSSRKQENAPDSNKVQTKESQPADSPTQTTSALPINVNSKASEIRDAGDLGTQSNTASNDPLTIAIDRFNADIREKYPFHTQPPLTRSELISYASWQMERNSKLPANIRVGITKIAMHFELPENWTIKGDYSVMASYNNTLSLFRIYLQTDNANDQIEIRRRFLSPGIVPTAIVTADEAMSGTSLASAVARFNSRNTQAAGQKQPPLTEDEVVAAILYTRSHREDYDVSDTLFDRFQAIASRRYLSDDAKLEVIPTFGVEGGSEYTIWSIRLTLAKDEPGREGETYGFLIREQFVSVKHGDAGLVHWGKPAENGLQVGVRLSPARKRYELGQNIAVEILYRNVLTEPISASVPNFANYKVEAHDQAGTPLEVVVPSRLEVVGGWRLESIGEKPISLSCPPIVLLPSNLSAEERSRMAPTANEVVVLVDPRKTCRLQFTVRNVGENANDILKTGVVDFGVDTSVSPDVNVKFDEATGVITVKGAKEDVERVNAVLEPILKSQSKDESQRQTKSRDDSSDATPETKAVKGDK